MALRAQTQHGAVLADGGVPIRVEQYEVSCGEGDIPGRGEILARVVWVDAPDHRTDLLQYGNSETGSGGGGGGYGRSTGWITPRAVRETLDTCPELEACVLAICGVLTARDRGLCDESTQAELLGHMSKVRGRGNYLGPHSYGALAWGVGHKEGTLPGSQYLEMGEGFDASRIRRLVKIAADVPAFNRLVRGVLPGWRTLDWRDVAYLFCMNGGSLGIATETTTPTGPRRSHVTGSERLWLALERIAVDKQHLASCIRTHVICM